MRMNGEFQKHTALICFFEWTGRFRSKKARENDASVNEASETRISLAK